MPQETKKKWAIIPKAVSENPIGSITLTLLLTFWMRVENRCDAIQAIGTANTVKLENHEVRIGDIERDGHRIAYAWLPPALIPEEIKISEDKK